MAIEEVYFGKNVRSAMAVGQASGVAMLAAAERGVRCFAYTPQAIKMAVCGSGGAGKKQVQRMVGTLLGLPEPPDSRPRRRRARGGDLPWRRRRAPRGGRGGDGGAGDGWRDDRRGPRRGAGPPARPRRHRRQRRRLQADGLLGDAEGGARRPAREAFLHAELVSRDDSLALFGFASEEERDLFGELVSVSGVGPKVAIATLSGGPARELLRAIAAGDAKRFQAVPGIGKRTAERIIVELRDKVAGSLEEEVVAALAEGGDARELARDGLVNLGYAPLEAEQLLDGLQSDDPQELIAVALRKAGDREGGMSDEGGINPNRIRTPGIEDEPVPIDAEVRVHDARADVPDEDLDRSLRPQTLADFVNQAQVTEQLAIFIEAAQGRGEPLDHVLLAGPPGLGKTSLAHIVAAEMGVPMVQTAGPALERKADVASFLTALRAGQRLLHRRDPPPRPRGRGDALPGDGGRRAAGRARPGRRRAHRHPAAAALHADRRDDPLRPADDAAARPLRRLPSARALQRPSTWPRSSSARPRSSGSRSTPRGRETIAGRSRGTPRVANRLLKRVRDFAQVKGSGAIDAAVAAAALEMLEVDAGGLDRTDRALLDTVATKFGGGPVGLSTLAVAIGEEQDTIEDVFEPYLLQQGLLKRTPRGRVLTERAYRAPRAFPPRRAPRASSRRAAELSADSQ